MARWGGFSDLKSWGKPGHDEEASLTPPVVENRGVSTKLPDYKKERLHEEPHVAISCSLCTYHASE